MSAGHLRTIFKTSPLPHCIHNYDFDCLWPHPPRSNVKRNNGNADEEIYLLSAAAKVVHDKQIANTSGYKVVLLRLQQQYALTSYVANLLCTWTLYREWCCGCLDKVYKMKSVPRLRYCELPSILLASCDIKMSLCLFIRIYAFKSYNRDKYSRKRTSLGLHSFTCLISWNLVISVPAS